MQDRPDRGAAAEAELADAIGQRRQLESGSDRKNLGLRTVIAAPFLAPAIIAARFIRDLF